MNKFSKNIYKLRIEMKLTQEDVAEKLDVSRQTISNWESGTVSPTIDKVSELAKLYNVTIDELVDVDKPKTEIESSTVIQSLLNQSVEIFFGNSAPYEQVKCQVIEVSDISIKVFYSTNKNEKAEKLIFLDDIKCIERCIL